MVEINWARWALLAVIGVPFAAWLLLTRNDTLRILAVLAVMIFIQDIFVWRRYLVAIGIGPSIMLLYVALLGLYLQRGRIPNLGIYGALWGLFLLAALLAAVIGSIGTGLLFFNIHRFQQFYIEGFMFFVTGLMVFDRDADVKRFFVYFVIGIGGFVALTHLGALVTGWRPASFASEKGTALNFGGVFMNPNSLGAFYSMTTPVAVMLLLRGRLAVGARLATIASLVLMLGSLILTGSRGGMLFSGTMMLVTPLLAGVSPIRVLAPALGAGLVLALGYATILLVLPGVLAETETRLRQEGLESNRFRTWSQFIRLIFDHPLGVGLHAENVGRLSGRYGNRLVSSHNLYLDHAVHAGFLGLLAFLSLVAPIVLRVRRAAAVATDPEHHGVVLLPLLMVFGFLLAGLTEPVYFNGSKLNHLFWLISGIGVATAERCLADADAKARSRREPIGWGQPPGLPVSPS